MNKSARVVRVAVVAAVSAGMAVIMCGSAAAATVTMYDIDGNGYLDPWVSDTSNNGYYDQNVIVVNGTYLWLKDANENWAVDQYGLDVNGDYSPDLWAMDANEDQVIEGFFGPYASPRSGPFPDQWTSIQQVLNSNPSWSVGPYGRG